MSSWARGFKASLGVLPKAPAIDRSADGEYKEETEKFKLLERQTRALEKEAKVFRDSLRGVTTAQLRVAETIEHFYPEDAPKAMAGHEYKHAVDEIDCLARDLDAPYRAMVVDPIERLSQCYPDINNAVQVRQRKLLDYDAARSRTRKPADLRHGGNLPPPARELEEARIAFEQVNGRLQSDLPRALDLRVPYLEASFEALVRMQLSFWALCGDQLSEVQKFLEERVKEEHNSTRLDALAEEALGELRDLSICGLSG